VVEIVVGTGGADLEGFKEARPNSLVAINDAHGVLDLALGAGSWSFRFVDVAGLVRDSGGGSCPVDTKGPEHAFVCGLRDPLAGGQDDVRLMRSRTPESSTVTVSTVSKPSASALVDPVRRLVPSATAVIS
jgi:hypothetical protein